jgi:hypothetical protein
MFSLLKRCYMRPCRLICESLEDRTVPAFNLAIDGDLASTGVSSVFASGKTTFEATASGATLNVGDIKTALAAGDVLISTGDAGSENGSISWIGNSAADDLDYSSPTTRVLTIQPDSTSLIDNITLNNVALNFNDNLDLVIDTTQAATVGLISLVNNTQINNAATVTLTASNGFASNDVELQSSSADSMASGDITITADTLQNMTGGYTLQSDQGNITINADVLLTESLALRAQIGTLIVNGAIDSFSAKDLETYGNTVALDGAIGSIGPLGTVTFAGGATTFTTNSITATTVNIGDGVDDAAKGVVNGTGTITANVDVKEDGVVAPGGTGTTGVMNITGDLTFDGGVYALDLGTTPDKIIVSGNLAINGGTLGDISCTGAITGSTSFTIIDFGGTASGAFDNAALNQPLIDAADAIRVTAYGPSAATDVTISEVPPAAIDTATGNDSDGTAYKFKLTGPGQLVVFKDLLGAINVVARDTTLASRITFTTKANASDDLVDLGPVLIAGDLGSFSAPNAILDDGLTARTLPGTSGKLNALSFYQVFASIITPGALNALTIGNDASMDVSALSIGTIKVAGLLSGGGGWNVVNGIASIAAGDIASLNITANYIGSLSAIGNKPRHLAGNISDLTLLLKGNDATPKGYGLKSFTAKSNVENSIFDVEGGNVGTVAVGRFLNSNLYVDYAPAGAFDAGGTFGVGPPFRIEKFSTTAITLNDTTSPFNYAFAGSQIVAETLGVVRLTGLDTTNPGGAFGFKVRTAGGSVQTKSSDSVGIALNKNLAPSLNALANDFFFLDV